MDQVFILFAVTVATEKPERLMDLLGYMDAIMRAAQKFAWPACEEYDRRFHQMEAGDDSRPWARLDAGLYTEYFMAQALTGPAARDTGRGGQAGQAAGPRKRPREPIGAELAEQDRVEAGAPVCGKYNRYRGESSLVSTAGSSMCVANARSSTQSRSRETGGQQGSEAKAGSKEQ